MRGLGSIHQTPAGTYRAIILIDGQRVSRTWPSRALAGRWLEEMAARKIAGSGAPLHRHEIPTVAEMADRLLTYWASGVDRVRTASTLDGYRKSLAEVVKQFGHQRLDTLRRADVDSWVSTLRVRGLSTSSIRSRLDRIAQMFRLAVDHELLDAEPLRVPRPKLIQRSEPVGVSDAEFDVLCLRASKLEDARVEAVIRLAGEAGLRRGEIVRLRGEHLRLHEWDGQCWGSIHIAVDDEISRTKSGRARTVPILTRELRDALRAVFPASGETLIRGVNTTHGIVYLASRVMGSGKRDKHARLHQLRHRACHWWAALGFSAKQIRDLAGHSTILTSEKYLRRRDFVVPPEVVQRLQRGRPASEFSLDFPAGRFSGTESKGLSD